VQKFLQRFLPRPLTLFLSFSLVLVVIRAFLGSLALSASMVASKAPEYLARALDTWDSALLWLDERGIPIDTRQPGIQDGVQTALQFLGSTLVLISNSLGLLALVLTFLLLAL